MAFLIVSLVSVIVGGAADDDDEGDYDDNRHHLLVIKSAVLVFLVTATTLFNTPSTFEKYHHPYTSPLYLIIMAGICHCHRYKHHLHSPLPNHHNTVIIAIAFLSSP